MSKHDEFPTKPDYEAKYKALEQAVKDALIIIDRKATIADTIGSRDNDKDCIYTSVGLKICIDILTEKTGITA